MALSVRSAPYFYTRVEDSGQQSYDLLAQLASAEVNLLAFSAVPFGPNHCELTIFPDDAEAFRNVAESFGWQITGPQHAFLVQGDDQLGALAHIHRLLHAAGVDIYASTGVTEGSGRFGYIIYIRETDHPRASRALGSLQNW
jgi:hypothetical protein